MSDYSPGEDEKFLFEPTEEEPATPSEARVPANNVQDDYEFAKEDDNDAA